jgi:hypothetical protein
LSYNREAENLEERALHLMRHLCEPLRKRPELSADVATFVKDLEGEAAA